MKRNKKYIAGFSIMGLVILTTLVFLILRDRTGKIEYQTVTLSRQTIEKKIIASGSIVPELEVDVKSSLSGVVDQIYVKAGDWVEQGTPLMSVQVIPNSLDLNSSRSALERSRIRLEESRLEKERMERLHQSRSISDVEYNQAVMTYRLAQQDFQEASNRMALIGEGVNPQEQALDNQVKAPISGTVLALPLKRGAPIQEQGGMSSGTTVASMADMDSLYFTGTVDEAQVGKLQTGLPVNLNIAALEKASLTGVLSFISPRGRESSGSVLFDIEVTLDLQENANLRAGYSASAEIQLEMAENVLAIQERDLIMEEGKYFVEVLDNQEPRRVEVTVGISDGIYTEVVDGLEEGSNVVVQL